MMCEIDEQLGDQATNLIVVPVGVGSLAQSVMLHYKAPGRETRVLTAEADTAGSLYKSLIEGEPVTLETNTPTIMSGLDCGTVSDHAWPLLQPGTDASLTISDFEAHEACGVLHSAGVPAGPCGAAPLAALRRLTPSDMASLGLNEASVIVIICSERQREYTIPRSVALDDAVPLCRTLVQINSSIPGTGLVPGPGEAEIARYITAWLEHRDIDTYWIEPTRGRPSVVGVVKGTGSGKSLLLNGHIDTVTTASYEGDAMSGHIRDGKIYGRGAADMKSGIAGMLFALAQAKKDRLQGDIIFTGVADEENLSIGTEQVLAAGWRADAAIVCEPTSEDLVIGHKGFVWFEVDIYGLAAHGSRFDLGVDAICKAGYFLVELDKYAKQLIDGPRHPSLGPGSIHASIIKGGEEIASYPAKCNISIERRTVAGETVEQLWAEMEDVLKATAQNVPDLAYDLRRTFSRNAFEIREDHPLVSLVADQIKAIRGTAARMRNEAFWTDCALIADAGMPVVMYGPHGEGLHAKEEWVDVESIENVASTLIAISQSFCGRSVG
jgi:acetylornithine deacetylase/succinyl-diaminopimelate desuccinylase family protein